MKKFVWILENNFPFVLGTFVLLGAHECVHFSFCFTGHVMPIQVGFKTFLWGGTSSEFRGPEPVRSTRT